MCVCDYNKQGSAAESALSKQNQQLLNNRHENAIRTFQISNQYQTKSIPPHGIGNDKNWQLTVVNLLGSPRRRLLRRRRHGDPFYPDENVMNDCLVLVKRLRRRISNSQQSETQCKQHWIRHTTHKREQYRGAHLFAEHRISEFVLSSRRRRRRRQHNTATEGESARVVET